MKFIVSKTSEAMNPVEPKPLSRAYRINLERNIYTWEIEVRNLEELLEIIESTKDKRVVIEQDGNDWLLEIYDTYRE